MLLLTLSVLIIGASIPLLSAMSVLGLLGALILISAGRAWPMMIIIGLSLCCLTHATTWVATKCLWVIISLLGSRSLLELDDLVSLVLGLELQTYRLYLMGAVVRVQELRAGGSMMYFVTGAVTSCVIFLGVALVYAEVRSFQLMALRIDAVDNECVGAWVLRARFLMKLGAAPFWVWAPLVYDAVPAEVGMFIASAPKLVLLSKLWAFGSGLLMLWSLSAVFSMIVGSLFGLAERRIRRVFALSGVAQVGFALIAASAGDWLVVEFYAVQYALVTVVLFATLVMADTSGDLDYQYSSTLAGWQRFSVSHGALALSLARALVSMGGIPPLVGFFAKMVAFLGVLSGNGSFMIAVALVASVVSIAYYLRVLSSTCFFDSYTGDAVYLGAEGSQNGASPFRMATASIVVWILIYCSHYYL